jgi:hypothetical protein
MKQAQFAIGSGVFFAALLLGIPFIDAPRASIGAILDGALYICSGGHAGAGSDAAGDEHHHAEPAGLYMPMFSTPPKGGAVYNGPPLDQC